MRIGFVSTWPSRRCGIATFTSDLYAAVHAADESVICDIAAIDERNSVRAYGPEVRWRIRQGSPDGYVAAARSIGGSDGDVVCVQHEFGLYGVWKDEYWEGEDWVEGTYIDHLTPFLQQVGKPVVVTMHTVLPEPSEPVRDAARAPGLFAAHGRAVPTSRYPWPCGPTFSPGIGLHPASDPRPGGGRPKCREGSPAEVRRAPHLRARATPCDLAAGSQIAETDSAGRGSPILRR